MSADQDENQKELCEHKKQNTDMKTVYHISNMKENEKDL